MSDVLLTFDHKYSFFLTTGRGKRRLKMEQEKKILFWKEKVQKWMSIFRNSSSQYNGKPCVLPLLFADAVTPFSQCDRSRKTMLQFAFKKTKKKEWLKKEGFECCYSGFSPPPFFFIRIGCFHSEKITRMAPKAYKRCLHFILGWKVAELCWIAAGTAGQRFVTLTSFQQQAPR